MPMDKGGKEAAIIMFAMPKPGKGVTPPTSALMKKSDKPALPESENEKPEPCEYCEGEGCEHCDYKGYHEEEESEGGYEAGAEDSHKKHMKIISKLVEMLDEE